MLRVIALAAALFLATAVQAQTEGEAKPAAPRDLAGFARWPLERIELTDGRAYEGLILSQSEAFVSFQEVNRRVGRPMYLITRSAIPRASVARLEPLPAEERNVLVERIERFQRRSLQEYLAMANVPLSRGEGRTRPFWLYQSGPWFRAESLADEEWTRQSIVRLEEMFTAFSEILPPRAKPERPLLLRLYDTTSEYRAFLAKLNYRIENPAVYVPSLNLLAAGSEVAVFTERLADLRSKHAALRKKYEQLAADIPQQLQKLAKELDDAGVPVAERKAAVLAAQRRWEQQVAEVTRQISAIENENASQFKQLTRQMDVRLYHEAFHAYLENFVYPQGTCDVPRWLNEGLAQVFEEGILEAGTLRLDAPSRTRLADLQADFARQPRLPLSELLAADGRAFLVAHPGGAETSQRYYLYSWGLAYYLAVREPVLETALLNHYVEKGSKSLDPIARFEALVGMPLEKFESKWREDMQAMKPPAR